MLMSLRALLPRYKVNANGALHLGAHLAEEAKAYEDNGIHDVWWVEANPAVIDTIKSNIYRYPQQHLVEALVYHTADELLDFHVTNYDGMSSSILDFGTHTTFSPDTVFEHTLTLRTTTVDDIVDDYGVKANFLNMDLQGAELHALQGASRFLQGVDYIMTEVNCDEVYVDCTQVEELDDYLDAFDRVETYWVPDQGWGDAFYIRRGL